MAVLEGKLTSPSVGLKNMVNDIRSWHPSSQKKKKKESLFKITKQLTIL